MLLAKPDKLAEREDRTGKCRRRFAVMNGKMERIEKKPVNIENILLERSGVR